MFKKPLKAGLKERGINADTQDTSAEQPDGTTVYNEASIVLSKLALQVHG